MERFIDCVLHHKKSVLTIFIIGCIFSVFLATQVGVNYNLMDYLPDEAPSTNSLKEMDKEFDTSISNARIMLQNVSLTEALEFKQQLKEIDGVMEVNFLDDVVSTNIPLEYISSDILNEWYRDGNALLTLTIEEDKQRDVVPKLELLVKGKGVMSGEAVNTVTVENSTAKEIQTIFLVVIPIILGILFLTTSSFFEPILFLVTIGVAILLNMGTNVFFGEISFVTKAAASILQLAVSIDYSIFLLHQFSGFRRKGFHVNEAMEKAVKASFSSILSSGLTTVVGFAALILMNFKIGPDMGLVMSKAIFFSLLCVLVLLPILAVYSYRLIDKTGHKRLVPTFERFSKFVDRARSPLCIIFLIILLPCYFGSVKNSFTYGSSKILGDETSVGQERVLLEENFGKSNQMVLMVPKGDFSKEDNLVNELNQIPEMKSIISYVGSVGATVPTEYAPKEVVEKLISEHYSRMILTVTAEEEGIKTFNLIDRIKEIVSKYYESYEFVGTSVNTYDLKDVVTIDNIKVNIASILFIFLILAINFKSLFVPIVLLVVIEGSIWINLTYVYFGGQHLSYIAYLIISSIQLGATIDYAILFTENYLENRKKYGVGESAYKTVKETCLSILTSASILMICGFMLGLNSINSVISQLGFLIGRGALISMILVIFILPGALGFFDHIIEKTTKNTVFYHKKEEKKMKRKKNILTTLFISTFLFLPNTVEALTKEENVYANLNYNGSVNGIYVVNNFIGEQNEKFCDNGDYVEIRNLSTTDTLSYQEKKVCYEIPGARFSYQGNMTSKNLPWNIKIQYYLDNQEVDGKDLAGKSGNLKIKISIKENKNVKNEYFHHYLMQATVSLKNDNVKDIMADGSVIANVSNNKEIKYTILAGNEKEMVIEAKVNDFEMDSITFSAVPMKMDVELGDTSKITSKVQELKNAISQIQGGTKAVNNAINIINDGAKSLEIGAKKMKDGLSLLNQNGRELVTTSNQIFNTLNDLDKKITKLYEAQKNIKDADIDSFITYYQNLITLDQEHKSIYESTIGMLIILKNDKAFIEGLYEKNISRNYKEFDTGIQNYVDATNQVVTGYEDVYNGFVNLTKGLSSLKSGSNTLYQGASELQNKTKNLDSQISSIMKEIEQEFNNPDYVPTSYLSNENKNVKNVQFVIKTEEIKKETEKVSIEEEKEMSLWDKFLNLFRK